MRQMRVAKRFLQIFGRTSHYARKVFAAPRINGEIPNDVLNPIMVGWGNEMMKVLNVVVEVTGSRPSRDPMLFVGNHVSYLDIPVLMSQVPVVFVAKEELASWPVIGKACRSVGTVMVKRESKDSRKTAADAIAQCHHERKKSITVFPAGTTTLEEEKPWRKGAFVIAKRNKMPVQPFRICYRPVRPPAFLMEDLFAVHLWKLLQEPKIEAFIEFHDPVYIDDPETDALKWWHWARDSLHAKLRELGHNPKNPEPSL